MGAQFKSNKRSFPSNELSLRLEKIIIWLYKKRVHYRAFKVQFDDKSFTKNIIFYYVAWDTFFHYLLYFIKIKNLIVTVDLVFFQRKNNTFVFEFFFTICLCFFQLIFELF